MDSANGRGIERVVLEEYSDLQRHEDTVYIDNP